MKKIILAVAVLSVLLVFVGCRSTNQTLTELGGKYEVIQVSDTGFVGHDNSGFVVLQKQPPVVSQVPPPVTQPLKKVTEVTTYESSSLTWTGCPDKGWKPNRRAKNIKRTEEKKKWTTERDIQPTPPSVVRQERVAIPIAVYGGGNASVGNSLLPSLATAGGIIGGAAVLRPSETNVTTNASGGTGTGGAGGAGGAGGRGAAAAAAATTSTSTGLGGAASGGSGAAAGAGN